MKKTTKKYLFIIPALILLGLIYTGHAIAGVQARYQYYLADFNGTVRSLWAKLAIDRERKEIFTLDQHEREIRIFNEYGMQVYDFGQDVELSGATDITLGDNGDIYVLFRHFMGGNLLRLDYRGQPLETIKLRNNPTDFQPFTPDRVAYWQEKFYLADSSSLDIVVTDREGRFQKGFAVQSILDSMEEVLEERAPKEKRHTGVEFNGFSVDEHGNLYFTIPVLFSAFRMSPAGILESFGKSGSAPGKFGVVAGIAADEQGNIYVADRLRSVVIIFDRNFNFIAEFGHRGLRPANLIVPDDVIIDNTGKIYVSQAANRGVSVFNLRFD